MAQIISSDAKWFFIIGEEKNSTRFIKDAINGAEIILQKGGQNKNIYYFTDEINKTQQLIEEANSLSTENIFPINKLTEILKTFKDAPFIAGVVSSHGDIEGIDEKNKIKPTQIIEDMTNIEGVKDSLLILGQCYSGVFNHMNKEHICILGSSKFTPSLSAGLPEMKKNNIWSANVFLYYFFEWIKNPKDVDGDKQYTILDGYKYTAFKTNNFIHHKITEMTVNNFPDEAQKRNDKIKSMVPSPEREELFIRLFTDLHIYHSKQEPFINNEKESLRLIFS